ncbi:hypothetical protein PFISCL1PPCAC_14979, partial [Pristionchus fissidentatus]
LCQMLRRPSTSLVQPSTLFNETREMYIVCAGDTSRGTPSKREMKLKIYERALDNNEREIRAELSCPSDDDFVYAGGVTKTTFPRLVEQFTVTVDFDNFAQGLIAQLTPSESAKHIDVYCVLSDNRSKCTLQICRPSDILRCTLPLEMRSVQGDELLAYLKGALRSQRRTAKMHADHRRKAEERIEVIESELARKREVDNENEMLKDELKVASEAAEDNKMDLNEWKQKFEAAEAETEEVKDEMEEMREEMERMKEEMEKIRDDMDEAINGEDEARMKNEGLGDEIDELNAKVARLEREVNNVNGKLREANKEIDSLDRKLKRAQDKKAEDNMLKYVQRKDEIQSCDERKLKELEGDLNEKNELIDKLSVNVTELTKRLEETESGRIQLEIANRHLQTEVEKANRMVDIYRRSSPIASHSVVPSHSSPLYSNSPLSAYSTPPTVPNTVTPSLARYPPQLGRLDLQHRAPLAPLNRPLTPSGGRPLTPNGRRPLNGINGGSTVPPSPQVVSYQAEMGGHLHRKNN